MAKRGSGKNGKKTVWTVLAVVSVLILIVCGVCIYFFKNGLRPWGIVALNAIICK